MTNWKGRLPTSYNETQWNTARVQIGYLSPHYLIDSLGFHLVDANGDRITGLATFSGSQWKGRTLPL